eukprot:CAMPEP_0170501038 /NCGR_PEP_ID=MMETSP0208-20121228/36942_1 /TAXON_ID=197538 /ORGANISM="Strombidium inclinatum, Strain S3" /LENGTH=127 /DNA_ID=CAMNT_0010779363 /DNA_START=243 /DNA_END=626 /DNA_ORIENTATION=+
MSFQNALLNSIFLTVGIIHISELEPSGELVVRVQGVRASLGIRRFLQRAGLCSHDISSDIRVLEASTLSRVEVTEALRAHCAAEDVLSFESGINIGLILARRRKHVGLAALHITDIAELVLFVTDHV